MLKRIGKILGIAVLVVLLLLVISAFLLKQEKVQNRLANKATTWLSEKLDTKVSIEKVKIDFLNRVHFKGLYIEDKQKDTLAYIHDFSANSTSIISDLWNDKTSIIKNIRLEGGVVNLLRPKDSEVWNYAFIEEAFATEDDEDTITSKPPKIDFKNMEVSNVRFAMLDKWGGQDIEASVGNLDLKLNGLDIENSIFDVKLIAIQNTDFSFKDYKGGKPKHNKESSDHSSWGSSFNPDNIDITLRNVDLNNVDFEYRLNGHVSKEGLFDERHIVASNIQLDLEQLKVTGDTITADIVNLSARERCGLDLKKFKSHVRFNQQLTELTDLYVETNRSVIQNYYRMRYANFHDFNDYISNVQMHVRFRDSYVDKRDIAFFAGNIPQLPLYAKLNGKAEGTVDNISIPQIHAQGPNIDFVGDARIVGLPDVDNTLFDLHADKLITTGNEIIRIAPEANTDAIKWGNLSKVDFKGNFKGTTKKFSADGYLTTNQGNVDIDMFMDLNGNKPSYDGYVKAKRLHLGNILGRKDIGMVSAEGKIKGQGFDFDNVAANVDAKVEEFYFDGTRYQNINVNGDVQNKRFSGIAKSGDPNLGFDFEGALDLSGENPVYDFKSDILKVNLKTLGITQQDVMLKAKVNVDFTGKNIDDFVGKAIMKDVTMSYDKGVVRIPQLRLNSYFTDSIGKVLDLKSTVADARIVGRYSFAGIDKSIRSFLHYYLPTYIQQESLPSNEIFDFNLLVRNANKIIQIYEPNLSIDSGTILHGNINTINQSLDLVGLVPSVTYDGIKLSNVGIKSKGNRSILNSEIVAANLYAGKSEIIKDATLKLGMSSDTVHFNLKTNPVDDFLGEANLDGRATAFSDRIEIVVNPSTFIVKDDKYRLFAYQPIQFTNDGILYAKDVLVQNGNQQLTFSSDYNGVTNDAIIETQNVDLEKVSKYINSKDLALNGRLNTTINVKDIWGKTFVTGSTRTVDYLGINKDTLGDAQIDFTYDKESNILSILEGSKVENNNAFLNTEGKINFDKSTLALSVTLKNTPIGFVSQYMEGIIDSLRGEATGGIDIKGAMDNPIIVGDMNVKNAGLKVIFTGCSYTMGDINLKLRKNSILFDPISIYDERKSPNTGTALLAGTITHSNYDKYRLKLNVASNDILGLNTDQFNGELFYGYIPSTLDMDITGAIDDITMNIKAEPLAKSQFFMPLEDGGDVGTYDFIKFRTLGRFQNQKQKKNNGDSYFKVNMDIKVTPEVLATIILDQNTQEKIEARGSGNISLNVDLGNSDIKMFNTYTVKEGLYKFNFKGLLSKDFDLEEGGTITWNGNAYDANLDMKAIYKTKASLYPLISADIESIDDQEEIRQAKIPNDIHVSIDLTGLLSKPNILFDIEQPNNRTIGGEAQDRLTQIKQDQNEVIYQAGMLLLFNSFKSTKGNGLSAGNLASNTVASTASDMVGSALSQGLTSGINKLGIPNISVNLDYKNYDVTSGSLGRRDQVNIGVQGSFFKDRFLVNVGNSLDFNDATSQAGGANSFNYGGDFRADYLITLDGRYRLNGFRVSNYDYVEGRPLTRGGLGLTYKKSFNNWNDLFKKKKKSKMRLLQENKIDNLQETGFINTKKEPNITTALQIISKFSY